MVQGDVVELGESDAKHARILQRICADGVLHSTFTKQIMEYRGNVTRDDGMELIRNVVEVFG